MNPTFNAVPFRTAVDNRVSRYVDRTANAYQATKRRFEQFPVAYAFFGDANLAYLAGEVRKYVPRLDIPSLETTMGKYYMLLADQHQIGQNDVARVRQLVDTMNKAVVKDYLYRNQVKAVQQVDYSKFIARPYGPNGVVAIRPINDNNFDRSRVTTSDGNQRRLW